MLQLEIKKQLKTENGVSCHQYNLECQKGECLGICGPSGSGKTSLLKMISGLMTPEWGKIEYMNKLFFHSDNKINLPPQKRFCGLLYQSPVLFPFLTLKENVLYGVKNEEKAEKYIKYLGLERLKNLNITKLSGGQLKRAAIAQLLTYNPSLLLLDEPFAFLDETWISKLKELIFYLCDEGTHNIIIVSHQKELLAQVADRIITIKDGRTQKSAYINHFPCRKSIRPIMYFSKPAG